MEKKKDKVRLIDGHHYFEVSFMKALYPNNKMLYIDTNLCIYCFIERLMRGMKCENSKVLIDCMHSFHLPLSHLGPLIITPSFINVDEF